MSGRRAVRSAKWPTSTRAVWTSVPSRPTASRRCSRNSRESALIGNAGRICRTSSHICNRSGVDAPLQIGQMQDFKDSTQVIAVREPKRPRAAEPRLLSAKRADVQGRARRLRSARGADVHAAGRFAGRAARESKAVMALETRLAAASMSEVEQRDPERDLPSGDAREGAGALTRTFGLARDCSRAWGIPRSSR